MESTLSIVLGLLLSCFSIYLSRQRDYVDLLAPPMIVMGTMWLQYFLPAFTLPYYDYWVYPHRWEKNQVVLYPILVSSVAWLAFLISYRSKWGRNLSRSLPIPILSCYTVWIGWILTAVGLVSLVVAIEQSGGLLQIIRSGSVAKGTGVWVILGSGLLFPGIALLWSYKGKNRVAAIIAAAIYFIVLTSAQARGQAVTMFIMLFIMTKYLWNVRNITLIVIVSVLALLIVLSASIGRFLTTIKTFSYIISFASEVVVNFVANMILTINRDLSRLEQLSIIMEIMPEQHNYFWGLPMLQSLSGPFRKYLFPDSVDWRITLTSIALYGNVQTLSWGMGGTGVGEWYANFGLGGVVIGWVLLGVGARCLYEWLQRGRQIHPARMTVVVYVQLLLIFWGCIGEGVGHIFSLWSLLPVVVTTRWKTHRTKTDSSHYMSHMHTNSFETLNQT